MINEALKSEIQQAYTRFLEKRGLKARYGQKLMIAEIARTLASIETDAEGHRSSGHHICVAEAGTGTGKTVAYALATIPVAKALGKKVVIATATVSLQEQIVLKDLPDIVASAGLSFTSSLAKGRGRYVCLSRLDQQLEGSEMTQTLALYPDELPMLASESALQLYNTLAASLAKGEWEGDRDSWPQDIPTEDWQLITTDHRQCTGRRCSYISQCSFYKAREQLQSADVIVANHDLVLADLSLGGGAILPEPEEVIYIFDEAHHLADKAISHFASHTRVRGTIRWAAQMEKTVQSICESLRELDVLCAFFEGVPALLQEAQSLLQSTYELIVQLAEFPDAREKGFYQRHRRYRFPHGVVPDALRSQAANLVSVFMQISRRLVEAGDYLSSVIEKGTSGIDKPALEAWFSLLANLQGRAESVQLLWENYALSDEAGAFPHSRWIRLLDEADTEDFQVCCSLINASQLMHETLWQRCFAAVLTSATLTSLGSWDRFRQRTGTPDDARHVVVPTPFDVANAARLIVPNLKAEPGDNEAHTEEVIEYLEQHLMETFGVLVLFSSRRQMEQVFERLDSSLRCRILLQGELSRQEIVQTHKRRIDAGEGSVIFGLASFAEGVDLPGDYCRHVIIAKIPFAVPDDPVEESLAEWISNAGGNPFMELAVPDAAQKLVQACGRLLRHEEDSGDISLLDRRIVTKRYGKAILDSLPPFRREIH